jgi:DNA-binding NarL/FixJ family response regulator
MTMRSRVLIWSDQPAFVKAMRSLSDREGLQVVGIARTADAALRCVQAHGPDVVLVDRQTGDRHPGTVVRLMQVGGATKVVAMDLVDEAATVFQGWCAPASTIRDLINVIEGHLGAQAA